jgi:hypothetical protein
LINLPDRLLDARRRRFNIDKVFAVSTTGFAPGAIEFAKHAGIVLRSVTSTSEIGNDWGTIGFRLKMPRIELSGYLDCQVKGQELFNIANQRLTSGVNPTKIRFSNDSNIYNIKQFILRSLGDNCKELNPDTDASTKGVFRHPGEIDLLFDDGFSLRATNIEIPITIHINYFYTKSVFANIYSEDGRVIGKEVAFRYITPEGVVRCSVIITPGGSGDIDVKLHRQYELTPLGDIP